MNRSFVACFAAVVLLSGCLLLGCSASAPQPEVSGNEASQTSAAEISFEPEADKIHVLINAQPFTTYHFEEKWDKPFLHPVRTLSGIDVSRGWPVEPREGESDDHIWHRGLFMGHDRINGADFWRELGRDKTATLVPRSTPTFSVADGQGTISAELDLLTTKKESLGAIRQVFTFSVEGDSAVIDANITILADRGVALTMGDTEEGWVGFRFDDAFKQENGATLLNSDGLLGTENIWGQARRLGRLFDDVARRNGWLGDFRPSQQPGISDVLACEGIRTLHGESLRREKLHRGRVKRRDNGSSRRRRAGVPVSPGDPSGKRGRSEGQRPLRAVQDRFVRVVRNSSSKQ